MTARIDVGGFRRVLRTVAPGIAPPGRTVAACPRRGVVPYVAVSLTLAEAEAGLERRTVPGLPPDVSREIRGATRACAAERGDAVWLVLHADGAFEAMAPLAFAAFQGDAVRAH